MLCEVGGGGCDDNERAGSGSHSIHVNHAPTSQHQSCSEALQSANRYIQINDTTDSESPKARPEVPCSGGCRDFFLSRKTCIDAITEGKAGGYCTNPEGAGSARRLLHSQPLPGTSGQYQHRSRRPLCRDPLEDHCRYLVRVHGYPLSGCYHRNPPSQGPMLELCKHDEHHPREISTSKRLRSIDFSEATNTCGPHPLGKQLYQGPITALQQLKGGWAHQDYDMQKESTLCLTSHSRAMQIFVKNC